MLAIFLDIDSESDFEGVIDRKFLINKKSQEVLNINNKILKTEMNEM